MAQSKYWSFGTLKSRGWTNGLAAELLEPPRFHNANGRRIRVWPREAVLAAADVPCLVPDEAEQAALMRVIYDGVKAGAAPETYRQELEDVLTALTARGADCFILGCTELPPAFRLLGLDAPVIDPTEELAKAAIRFCGYHVKGEP